MLTKIGILTSGGDAPGMNATVIGAIKAGIALNKDMYVVYDGYKGLIEKNFKKVDKHFIEDKLTSGGTAIKTARLPEFKEEEVRKVAVKNMKEEGIEALIVIGGDGSYMGAKRLTEMGINCIGLPGTIDNDIASSDYTIGFDTALNTVVNAIDQIRDTMTSHNRCAVVEIMGNKCPDLTSFAAIATNADEVFTCDHPLDDKNALFDRMEEAKRNGKESYIILVAEKLLDTKELEKELNSKTSWETRLTVLGHIQRGGKPTAMERVNAVKMGAYAVELLDKGIGGVCVGIHENKLRYVDIYDALKLPRDEHRDLYQLHELIK